MPEEPFYYSGLHEKRHAMMSMSIQFRLENLTALCRLLRRVPLPVFDEAQRFFKLVRSDHDAAWVHGET